MQSARRLARRFRILAVVILEPGLTPAELADRAAVSERTLRRDLHELRRLGYDVTWGGGYELQERFDLDGAAGGRTLADLYAHQVRLLHSELPAAFAEQVAADVEALAPAALASLVAAAIDRRLEVTP